MAAIHIAGFILVLSFILECSADPGHDHHHHTKHVIHAPLHIKMIHHHKIVRVPVVIRKHHHHHKHLSHENVYIPLKEKPKPVYVDSADDGTDEGAYPAKIIKIIRPTVYQSSEVSGEGSNELQGQYASQIGGIHGGQHSSDRSEDYSYEYDESQENIGNQYHHGRN